MKVKFSLRAFVVFFTVICLVCASLNVKHGSGVSSPAGYNYDWHHVDLTPPFIGPLIRVDVRTYWGGTIKKNKITDLDVILWDHHMNFSL